MKKCIHCLDEKGPFNEDHVFPEGWYPENTPPGIEKPTAPSCLKCNNSLSKVEERLLRVFSFGFSPNERDHKEIYERMKRSISESAGKSERDKRIRAVTKKNFFRDFYPIKIFPKHSIVNPNQQNIEEDSLGVVFSRNTFLKKVTKGIIYNCGRVIYVPPIYEFSFFHFQCPPIGLHKIQHVKREFGPGFSFWYWEHPEFPPNSIVQIKIWQVLNFWITVENPILIPGETNLIWA